MNYWLIKDLDGNALSIMDRKPELGYIETTSGAHVARVMKMKDESGDDVFVVCTREQNKKSDHADISWVPHRILTPITKAQYETYNEMGLFDDNVD